MSDYSARFKSVAKKHIERINGSVYPFNSLLLDTFFNELNHSGTEELKNSDIELLTNQLVNQLLFGPITNMELFLTEDCNLACTYCFVHEKVNNSMPIDLAIDSINFLVLYSGNSGKLNITLFGGEPLLEKENIYRIVEHCNKIEKQSKSKKITFSATTNGTLVDEELLKRVQGRVNFLLSFDGDEETHDLYRKDKAGNGTFKRILDKISLLKRYQGWLGSRMTVMPDTVHKLNRNVSYQFDLGINQFLIGLANDIDWPEQALIEYEAQMRQIGRFYLKKKKEKAPIRITFFEKEKDELECSENVWGCGAGRNTISVTTNGDIYPCSKFVGYEKFDCPELKLGNIYEGITNMKARKMLAKMKPDDYKVCTSCDEMNACRGGCPADNYYKNKSLYKPAPSACELKKAGNRILRELSVELDGSIM